MPRQRRGPKPRRQVQSSPNHDRLPQITANPICSVVGRFGGSISTTAGSETVIPINSLELQGLPGCLATGTNQMYAFAQSFRIRKVEVWMSASNTSGSTPIFNSCSIVWYNNLFNQLVVPSGARVDTDSSLSLSSPCHVISRPDRTLSGTWISYNGNTRTLFDIVLTGPTSSYGLMVDVTIDYVISNQSFPSAPFATATTLSPGNVYYPSLDTIANHLLMRQALPGTF